MILTPTQRLAIIGVGGLVLWYVAVRVLARLTRPRSPRGVPATPELRDDSPAIVNLLVNRGRPTTDAGRATLLDLAARDIIEVFQAGDDPLRPMVRIRDESPSGLTSYEQRIFDRLRQTAPDGRLVPLAAVTDAYAAEGWWWWDSFRREVRKDAQKAGYTDDSWFSWSTVLLLFGAFFVAGSLTGLIMVPFTGGLSSEATANWLAIGAYGCLCLTITTALILVLFQFHDYDGFKEPGNAATSHWLGVAEWLRAHGTYTETPAAGVAVWDRYLAYGVALGTNPVAAAAVHLEVNRREMLWSRHTGEWRRVAVVNPRTFSTFGSPAGAQLIWSSIAIPAWLALAWYVHDLFLWWVPLLLVLVVWRVLRNVYLLVRAVLDLLSPVTITGTLLTLRNVVTDPEVEARVQARRRPGYARFVIDDGRFDQLRPFQIRRDRVSSVTAGSLVTIVGQRYGRAAKSLVSVPTPVRHP